MGKRKHFILNIFKKEPETLDELAHCVIAVINSQNVKVVGFQWDIKFGNVSNSHCSPQDFPTNWSGRDKNIPRHYPGWYGRVWVRYHYKPHGFGSDPFSSTLTHTGTGGFGGYDGPWDKIMTAEYKKYRMTNIAAYSWDYKFFQSDWPELERQERTMHALQGKEYIGAHFFSWSDPETNRKDEEFIQECKNLQVGA